jgi:hypothetical protein
MVDPVVIWQSETMRSHFGRAVFEDLGVDVESMGAVQNRHPGGPWSAATDPAVHRHVVFFGPMRCVLTGHGSGYTELPMTSRHLER